MGMTVKEVKEVTEVQEGKKGRAAKPPDVNKDDRIEQLKPALSQKRDKYFTAILVKGGHIYCIPASASQVLRINFLDMGASRGKKKANKASEKGDPDDKAGE